jgi:PAS domain S-box-containing protein
MYLSRMGIATSGNLSLSDSTLSSDALIALAYYSIPLTLSYFVRKRQDLPFISIFLLFSAFIIACGTTHLMEIWTLWHPTYWLSGVTKLLTAVISGMTAVLLMPIVSRALALSDPAELESANLELEHEVAEYKRIEEELIRSRDLREAIFNESTDALFLVDAQTLLTLDCNRRAIELFEADEKAELIGVEGHTLQRYRFSQAELDEILAEMQVKGFWSRDLEYITRQGNSFWGNIAAKPIMVTGRAMNLVQVTDISDRKRIETEREQAEQALRMSEARYRAIVQDQTELIARFQPDGTLTFVNDAYCRYFGVNREDLIGHHYEPIVLAEDRDQVAQQVYSMKPENPMVVIENRVMVGEEVRWTQWSNRAFFDAQGHLKEFQAVGRDIQALKQIEEALRQSDRRFRAIFNTMFQFIGLLTPERILLEANQTALEFAGLTHDDVINQPFWEARWWTISSETQAQLKAAIAQSATGQFIRYEVDVLGVGDTVATIDFSLKPIWDETGKVVLLIPEGRDISDRKQIEQQLELQAIIVKNMAEGICLVRVADEAIVYANPKFEQMFGYDANELTGKHVSVLNYGDENKETTRALMQKIMAHGEATYEVQNVRKNGTCFWCGATTSVFEHPEHGTVLVAVQQDITKQKRANDLLKASLEEKEVLLKEIHHRVKNNLGIIDGLLQMQSRRSPNIEVVETLKDSQNRIASIALVHEKLYRSDDLANIDFSQYILDLTAHLLGSYNTHTNRIKLRTQADNISLNIDKAIPCGLIINELVSNALKYAFPHDSVGEICIELRRITGETITLTVKDNGMGLPEDFDLQKTKTLGLRLIQGLVSQLNGTLEMNNQHGANFKITLNENHHEVG